MPDKRVHGIELKNASPIKKVRGSEQSLSYQTRTLFGPGAYHNLNYSSGSESESDSDDDASSDYESGPDYDTDSESDNNNYRASNHQTLVL